MVDQISFVFCGWTMLCSSLPFVTSSVKTPLFANFLVESTMPLPQNFLTFLYVSEFAFPRNSVFGFVNRQHCAMSMWWSFVEVYVEADDVLLTELFRHEVVCIDSPFLDILLACQFGIVGPFAVFHCLFTECNFTHSFAVAAQNELSKDAIFTFCIFPFIGIFDSTLLKDLVHFLVYRHWGVDGLDLSTSGYFEVQMCPGRIIVLQWVIRLVDPHILVPIALLFVAFSSGYPFLWRTDIHHLFSHIWSVKFGCYDWNLPELAPRQEPVKGGSLIC